MKKYRILSMIWAMLVGGLLTAGAQTSATFDMTVFDPSYQGGTLADNYTVEGVQLTFSSTSEPGTIVASPVAGSYVELNSGTQMVVTAPTGMRLSSVSVTTTETGGNPVSLETGQGSLQYHSEDYLYEWFGSTNVATFVVTATGGITDIVVNYAEPLDLSLVASEPNEETTSFNFNNVDTLVLGNVYHAWITDYVLDSEFTTTKAGITLTSGQNPTGLSYSNGNVYLKVYQDGIISIQTPDNNLVITSISFVAPSLSLVPTVGTLEGNLWTGSSQVVEFKANGENLISEVSVTYGQATVPPSPVTVDLSTIPQTDGSTEDEPRAQFRFTNVNAATIDEYVAYMEFQNTPVEGYTLEGEEATIAANNVILTLTTPNFLKTEDSMTLLKVDNGAMITVSVPEGYRIDNIGFEGEVSQLKASAGQIDGQTWSGTGSEEVYGLSTVTFTATGTASIYSIEVNVARYTTLEMPIITANGNTITIESSSPEATIRYSVDGSTPDMYSPAVGESFTYSGPFEVSQNCVVKAIAGGTYMQTSEVAEFPVDWFQVDTVTFNRVNLELTMTCPTPDATILYTVEGTVNASPDTLTYTGPIQLGESCEIHALGRRAGWKDSEVRIYEFDATDAMAATPQIYRNGDVVEMMTTTPGATIYYTIDGTTPDMNSMVYADAIMPDSNYTIRAIAVAENYFNSDVAEFNVDWLKVADVTFLYENLYLKMSTTTPGAEIYYTIDGTMPGINSTHYVDSISLDQSCMVQAIAIRDGWNDSEVTNYEFVMEAVTAAMPQFARGNGNELIIATTTQGANIYYTIDGSMPTTESTLYTAPIELDGNYTVNAIAAADALITSEVGTFNVDWYKVADVTFSYKNLKLAMATTTPDAEIYYTIDGTTPDINSTLYTDSISLDQDCEVRAIAIRNHWNDSEVTTYTFSLSAVTAATPLISHNNNKILIETSTAGAVIYYTTDGSTPTTTSAVYADSIIVTSNCTIKAIATGMNLNPSEITTYEVDWFKVGNVEFMLHELRLFMTAVPDTAAIYYTTDGSAPTVLSTRYTEPVALTTSCDVRAIAMIENWANSDVTLFHFNAVVHTAAKPQIIRNGNELTMSTTTGEAHIYYTTDGTEPNEGSLEYAGTPISLDGNCTIRAIALGHNYLPSAVSTYTVDWFKVADVEFTWSATSALTLELSTATAEAAIYYTTDGSIPRYVDGQAINGQLYQQPLTMTQQDMDIRAIAVRERWTNSDATLFHFNSASMTIATPQIVRNGTNMLNITCATPNVAIYYTLNGAEPTVNDSLYSHPIVLDGNCIVRSMAMNDSQFRSATASYQVDWFKVASVDFTFNQNEGLIMTTTTPNAAIYYTINGTTPSATLGTAYTAPVQLTESRDVRAIAVRENWTNSEISLFHYIFGSTPAATPQFVRNGNELTITTETAGAEIFYTLDGTTPTAQAEHYDAPVSLTENGLVKAIAIVPGESQSGVASYTVNWFAVENVLFSFNNEQLVMQTATPGATIYYTLDGTTPTRQSSVYTDPVPVTQSCLVQAFGTRENMHDSNISRYDLDLDNLSTATPVIERIGNTLVITCATLDATIYYTTDGSLPTPETGHVYESPIVLSQNCTVRSIAVAPGYRNSGVADYTTDTFRVEDVHVEFVDGFLYLFTNTAGATIYYTLNGADPTTSSDAYQAPIPLSEKTNVKAFATKKDFTNSQTISVEVDPNDVKCAEPTITQNDRMLIISTVTSGAQIYYTTDGSTPTPEEGKLYVGPDSLTHNCIVQAIAVKEGQKNSTVGALEVNNFQTELPEILFDKADNSITFKTGTPGATIYYTTDESAPTTASTAYSEKLSWDGTSTYRVMAVAANFNNSAVVTFNPGNDNTCAPVTMTSYNGNSFTLSSTDDATIYYTLDGSNPTTSSLRYSGETAVSGLSTIRAIAVKEGFNNSNVTIVELPCYFDGQTAYLRKAGSLSIALGDLSQLSKLNIVGNMDAADFTAIRNAKALRYLNLRETATADGILPDGSLASTGLVSVELPAAIHNLGTDAFAGCDNLAALIWNANVTIPDSALRSISNPNLLLYVNRAAYAPGSIRNVVAGYQAQSITLSDAEQAGNFYCPRAFYAQNISYTHNYQLKSGRNKTSCGWETLALPFNVTSVQHETKGQIVPFASKDASTQQLPKFWLYTLDANTGRLVATSDIEANSPYLVCMPNNEDYADRFNLGGNVSFTASNAMIPITEAKTISHSQDTFVPNFERKPASDKIFLLNRNVAGRPDGQIFLQGLRQAAPFEAYMTNSDSSVRAIDLFSSETDDMMAIFNSQPSADNSQSVYDLQGRKVKESQLKTGLYIVNGKKHIVK